MYLLCYGNFMLIVELFFFFFFFAFVHIGSGTTQILNVEQYNVLLNTQNVGSWILILWELLLFLAKISAE